VPKEASLTRRSALQLLVVAAASAVAGCRSGKQQATPAAPATGATPASRPPASGAAPSTRTTAPTAGPPAAPATLADPTAQAAATSERAMVAAYDDAMRAHPELATALGAFRADHAAHLKALNPDVVLSPAPVPSSTGSSSAPASPPASPPAATVLATLTDLETRAAAARLGDMATATGSLAALLASIGGCEAAHAATLAAALGSP
jgi:Ferritin-like domain